MTWWRGALGIGMMLFWAIPSAWPAEAHPYTWSRADLQQHRFSTVRGMKVENLSGEKIGRVKDLIIDVRLGQLKYGVIGSSSVAGLRSQQRIVPAYALSLGTAKRNTLALNTTRLVWKKTPALKKRPMAALDDRLLLRQLSLLYPEPGATNAGASSHQPPGAKSTYHLASELIGRDLVGRNQEKLGEVVDLLLDFKIENTPLIIVSLTTELRRNENFVVPLRACRQIPDNKLLVTFNRAVFERAQRFDPNAWDSEGLQTDSVYRYDDTDPDNTRRNRRDRQPASLTPSNQSEAEADRGLTQRIRRAVSNNDALSLTSKNVKIITIAGKVTLRGPVRGQSEKAEIVRLAVQIAGAANVDDQMEVTR